MAELGIVLGRPGTGKSYAICEKIKTLVQDAPIGPPILWIVPDEIAYTTERTLMNHFETALRVEVITLRRLAERIMGMAGNTNSKIINTTGKRLVLASVYREAMMHLGPLRRDNPSIAFFDSILNAFDELSDHLVDIARLEGTIETAAASLEDWSKPEEYSSGRSLLSKLQDLCLLYIRYRHALENGHFLDPAFYLTEAAQFIRHFEPLKDAVIFLDGYADMSPQMLQFAIELAKRTSSAEISLSIDPAWLVDSGFQEFQSSRPVLRGTTGSRLQELMALFQEQNHVFMPKTLYFLTNLMDVCAQNQIMTQIRNHVPYQRYNEDSDLHHIEENVYGKMIVQQKQASIGVRIAIADNIRAEVTGIAKNIMRLSVKAGISFDEIAVIVPSIDGYQGAIEDAFSKYNIPYNLDAFPPLTEYPLAKFLLAVLSVVREEFSASSVVRLVKTDFCGLSEEEADWFETYIRAYEISSPHEWLKDKPWTYMDDISDKHDIARILEDDARAERDRQKVIGFIAPFYDIMKKTASTPIQVSNAIWNLFSDVHAKQVIANWMVNEDGSQNPLEASLHEQAWQSLIALCDDLACVAPEVSMTTSDLVHVLFADLEKVSLSTIPTAINHVLVTDFSRAHGWTSGVVFVAGLTDQAIPQRFVQTGLLQDEERIAFSRLFGIYLGYTSADHQLAQRDDIYHLLTRAKKSVILSYPLLNSDGREARPSNVLARIRSIFVEGSLQSVKWHQNDLGSELDTSVLDSLVLTPPAALDLLVDGTRGVLEGKLSPMIRPILSWFCENEQRKGILVQALRGFMHHHDTHLLGKKLSEALYGKPLKMNVYQLEAFAACPYKHFIQYGLKIDAQDFQVVSAATKGTLMHDVLLSFVQEHMQNMENWRSLSDEAAVQSMEAHFHRVLDSPKFFMWHKEAIRIFQANDVHRSLRLAAVILTHHARFGRFDPHSVELSFGLSEPGSLPGFDVELEDGVVVSLRGRIDRVDLLTHGDEFSFRIIDYKSSQLDIDLTKVEHGLRLQLPVYAAAIEQNSQALFGKEARAVGMLYIPVLRKVELKNVPVEEQKALFEVQKHMRARGWMVEEKRIVEAMDKRLTDAQDSELFTRVYTKSQTVAKYAPALPSDEWNMLVSRAVDNVRTLAKRILEGDVRVSPYRIGLTETACQNCPFQALCQFDPNYDQHLYRRLDKVSRWDIHEKWSSYVKGVET